MKKSILLCLTLLYLSTSFARSKAAFKIGLGAGVNFAKIKEKYYSDINKGIVAFDASIPMEIRVAKYFALQPEIHFIQKGFSLNYDGVGGVDKVYRRRIYAQIPLNFKLIIPVQDKVSLNAYLGFGVGYALTNQQITKYTDGTKKKETFPYDNNVNDDNLAYRRYDLCMPIGFGADVKVSEKITFFTDIRFDLDLNNNIQYKVIPSPTPQYYYRNIVVSMGIFFITNHKK